MGEYFFRTSDLDVGYNGKTLIHDININLKSGEILTLIGPNGSGKSTILKSITKHLAMLRGDAMIADASVNAMSYRELATKLAVVLTERIKGELLTCYDVVATGRYPYTSRMGVLSVEDRAKVIAAMDRVQTADLADRDFGAISDGQRQRVLLARAICQEPEIIVLDEPTSFLDIKHKLELLSILREMAKEQGITVIMSLHEIDLAEKISDKIMCVKDDMISHFGTPEEIFTEDIITDLYGITRGSFNLAFGSVELPAPKGEPDVFVVSACGTGIDVFRRLQREDRPFYCGILYENDIDFQVASNLAAEVVNAKPFEPISEEAVDRAYELIGRCSTVIDAGVPDGRLAAPLKDLLERAENDPDHPVKVIRLGEDR